MGPPETFVMEITQVMLLRSGLCSLLCAVDGREPLWGVSILPSSGAPTTCFPLPGSPFYPAWPWVPLVQPQHPLPHTPSAPSCESGRSRQRPSGSLVFLFDFSLQINHFSVLLIIPCCLIIPPCRVCLLLLELPGNGTKNPRETLLRSQARSHGDICGGKCSPYQQTAVMQIQKHTQINRLAPSSKPEIHPHGQMLQQVYMEPCGYSKTHV